MEQSKAVWLVLPRDKRSHNIMADILIVWLLCCTHCVSFVLGSNSSQIQTSRVASPQTGISTVKSVQADASASARTTPVNGQPSSTVLASVEVKSNVTSIIPASSSSTVPSPSLPLSLSGQVSSGRNHYTSSVSKTFPSSPTNIFFSSSAATSPFLPTSSSYTQSFLPNSSSPLSILPSLKTTSFSSSSSLWFVQRSSTFQSVVNSTSLPLSSSDMVLPSSTFVSYSPSSLNSSSSSSFFPNSFPLPSSLPSSSPASFVSTSDILKNTTISLSSTSIINESSPKVPLPTSTLLHTPPPQNFSSRTFPTPSLSSQSYLSTQRSATSLSPRSPMSKTFSSLLSTHQSDSKNESQSATSTITSEPLSQTSRSEISASFSSYTAQVTLSQSRGTPTPVPELLVYDGELVVSVRDPSKPSIRDLRKLSYSIESTLDDVYKPVQGFLYSKVLQIINREQGKLECHFKLFIKKPSLETSENLKEKLIKYNDTQGFGEFTLHSVDALVDTTYTDKDTIKLWTIIVMAVLGALCFVLLVIILIYLVRRIRKSKSKREFSSHPDDNGNKRYLDFTTLFDAIDETHNIPLKLAKPEVSPSHSKKPLKVSTAGTDSETENEEGFAENGELRKMSHRDSPSTSDENEKIVDKEPDEPASPLHIQDEAEDDETKFSTFSRKR